MRLTLIAITFVLLSLSYDTLTPIFENSDETLHYPVVKHIADGNGLPIAEPGRLWNQEGTQPPLYYAIVAASTAWLNTDTLLDHLQYNPHWRFTELRTLLNDNQNRVLHGPMDAFPYRQAALAIHIGRWWSLFFGLLTVIGTYGLATHFFPKNPSIVIFATSLVAFNPQFLRVSATVSNDTLAAALTTLTVWLTVRVVGANRSGRPTQHTGAGTRPNPDLLYPILIGLLCGLAILTKLSSLSVGLLVGLILVGWGVTWPRGNGLKRVAYSDWRDLRFGDRLVVLS